MSTANPEFLGFGLFTAKTDYVIFSLEKIRPRQWTVLDYNASSDVLKVIYQN